MSEMVERVARAICEADLLHVAWDDLGKANREAFLRYARAAIAAMREPTAPMIEEGWRLLRGNLRPDEIYPHMIDKALEP